MADLTDDWDDNLCCDYAEWIECDCDDAWDDCPRCYGEGSYVPDHCCACGGSPYCQCCRTCGASCVAECPCALPVTRADGSTFTV